MRPDVCRSPDDGTRAEVAYSEARQYFEAQHWEEAAVRFHDVALGPHSDEVALYAAQLSLEAVNVLENNLGRADCKQTLVVWLDEFLARLCAPAKHANAEECNMLAHLKSEIAKAKR